MNVRAQTVATEENVTISSQRGVLMLKNGGTIQGEISRLDDRWLVKTAGREMQVPASSVEMACRSIEEAYDAKQKSLVRPTAEAHLTLADWCLRNELLPQAALELTAARSLDPRHLRLALLDQRLAVAAAPRSARPIAASATPVAASTPARQSDANRPTSPSPQLTDAIVERFTRRVQPVLINNCTTAGCHQPGGAERFQLDRALLHGLSNRRSTMSNLSATLALVDRERPRLSPLLTVPRSPHGGMKQPVFGPNQAKLVAQLVDWVSLVTGSPAIEEGVAANIEKPLVPTPIEHAQHASFDESATLMEKKVGPRYGAQLQSWQPKDAFDPEIFNRRFRGESIRAL